VTLEAEMPTLRAFVLEDIAERLAFLADARLLAARQIAAIERIIAAHGAWLDWHDAVLAHGDFDATHLPVSVRTDRCCPLVSVIAGDSVRPVRCILSHLAVSTVKMAVRQPHFPLTVLQ
jgi:hypothetical protein